jgi:hypothetical protein
MPTLEIHDMHPDRYFLAVDLRHVLAALKVRAANADWEVGAVTTYDEALFWAVGDENAVQKLEALAASGERISGRTLEVLANKVHQVIWGEFRAFDHAGRSPWVIVRAVDSTLYEVDSKDPTVAEDIQSAFTEVRIRE